MVLLLKIGALIIIVPLAVLIVFYFWASASFYPKDKYNEGKPLIIINIHVEAFDEVTRINHTVKVKELAESYARLYPVLLIGDFNSYLNRDKENNPSIKLLLESNKLKSAFSLEQLKTKQVATYPSNELTYTLDYIFYNSERIEFIESQLLKEAKTASGHIPIMMKFRLR